jgi:hypothetical protein
LHASFAFINGALLAYAVGSYIGLREVAEDIGLCRLRDALSDVTTPDWVPSDVEPAATVDRPLAGSLDFVVVD